MHWLNIPTSFIDSPEFVGCEPTERATWLCLLRYCAGQENGGVIADAGSWGDRKWQQLARVTLAEVKVDCALWSWSGDSLSVLGYPQDKERMVKEKRDRAHENGKRGGRPKTDLETNVGTNIGYSQKPILVISGKAERKGKEGNGIEVGKKVRAAQAAPTSDSDWLAELAANPAYQGINVGAEYGKAQAWCGVNRKQLTRRRFINWLNRAEKPMPRQVTITPQRNDEPSGWRGALGRLRPGNTFDGPWAALPDSIRQEILQVV